MRSLNNTFHVTLSAEVQMYFYSLDKRQEFDRTFFSWFGSEIDKLLLEMNAVFRGAAAGELWNTISSYMASLKAKELIGLAKLLALPASQVYEIRHRSRPEIPVRVLTLSFQEGQAFFFLQTLNNCSGAQSIF